MRRLTLRLIDNSYDFINSSLEFTALAPRDQTRVLGSDSKGEILNKWMDSVTDLAPR